MTKKTKQQFDSINQKLDVLLGDAQKKAQKYDELKKNLKKIDIHIKKMSNFREENSNLGVTLVLEIPNINIHFDDNNEIVRNEELVALNELNLLNVRDMQRISLILQETHYKNKIS